MFTQVSETPVDGWVPFTNRGFGNRCVICGSYFDEGGICNNQHEQGKTYYSPPQKEARTEKVRRAPVWRQEEDNVTCGVFSGCRCTICGSYFEDSALDTVCQNGHEIGQTYRKTG